MSTDLRSLIEMTDSEIKETRKYLLDLGALTDDEKLNDQIIKDHYMEMSRGLLPVKALEKSLWGDSKQTYGDIFEGRYGND